MHKFNPINKDYKVNKISLTKNFLESLNNPYFKEIVTKLNLSNSFLEKYTSNLEDAALEYENCSNCKNILGCKNKVMGHAYLPKIVEENLVFNFQACRYQRKINNDTNFQKNVFTFNVPKMVKEARIKNIIMDDENRLEVIEWISNFLETYDKTHYQKGLYLHGNFGCGKTYLIAALFNELAISNIKSAIVFWPEYLQDLKTKFGTEEFKMSLEKIKKVPILLIDDIGAENMTSWARDDIFCPIVQYRMQEELTTFFTSNMTLNQLEEHFSISKDGIDLLKAKRIIERVKQLTIDIELISENLRK